jgi:hypothetical protein
MTVNELIDKMTMYNDLRDVVVVCNGREIDNAYHFEETPQEHECICLSLKSGKITKKEK